MIEKVVLQGSLLGSFLSLVCINGMTKLSSKFESILYADDTTYLFLSDISHESISYSQKGPLEIRLQPIQKKHHLNDYFKINTAYPAEHSKSTSANQHTYLKQFLGRSRRKSQTKSPH